MKQYVMPESGERKRNLTTLVLVKRAAVKRSRSRQKVSESSQNPLKWSCTARSTRQGRSSELMSKHPGSMWTVCCASNSTSPSSGQSHGPIASSIRLRAVPLLLGGNTSDPVAQTPGACPSQVVHQTHSPTRTLRRPTG